MEKLLVILHIALVLPEMISTDSTCRQGVGVGRVIRPRLVHGFKRLLVSCVN